MSAERLSLDDFNKCIDQIVLRSDTLGDNWKLHTKQNGRYITSSWMRNVTIKSQPVLIKIECHVVYKLSYAVPMLCFKGFKSDGTQVTADEFCEITSLGENNSAQNMYEMLSQMDHPVLLEPFLVLHPCKTHEIMELFLERSKNPVISWLSVVGPLIFMPSLDGYFQYC